MPLGACYNVACRVVLDHHKPRIRIMEGRKGLVAQLLNSFCGEGALPHRVQYARGEGSFVDANVGGYVFRSHWADSERHGGRRSGVGDADA